MAVIMKAFRGSVFDNTVHLFDLPIGPRVVWFCEARFDTQNGVSLQVRGGFDQLLPTPDFGFLKTF